MPGCSHSTRPVFGRRLLGDLLFDPDPPGEEEPARFVRRLEEVHELSGRAPVLVLDQFEEVLRPAQTHMRARMGMLLAATTVRRADGSPPCRWILAVRKESYGAVMAWLRDVLFEARKEDFDLNGLPHDVSGPERLQSMALPPLATVRAGERGLETASRVFEDAITRPLKLRKDDGNAAYPWRFAPGGAERLAHSFARTRLQHPSMPLGPELQVVLAHLLDQTEDDEEIEVPMNPEVMIENALEDHLRRALDAAFPGDDRIGRARGLLALRELATASGKRDEGLPPEDLRRAIGERGEEILEKLSSPLTRLIVAVEAPEGLRYALSHDRLAEVVSRVVEEEDRHGGLLVDRELLALRRIVTLQSALYTAGEEHAARLPRRHFRNIAAHAEALLWDEDRQAWWAACGRRRRSDRLRLLSWSAAAVAALFLVVFGAVQLARSIVEERGFKQDVAEAEASDGLAALYVLRKNQIASDAELLELLRARENPSILVERGLKGLAAEERNEGVVSAVEVMMPLVGEDPENPILIANLVWALDYAPGRHVAYRGKAESLKGQVLKALRDLYPPPPMPVHGDPEWVEIPGGRFWMGMADDDLLGEDKDRPRHEVEVAAFRMQRHEVTNAQYRLLVPGHKGDDDLPARFVNWYQARTYAAWLGGRLATEAEWEYAARAGCEFEICDAQGRAAELEKVARFGTASPLSAIILEPLPVMRLEPNAWGLYDLLGNVWEWTDDWFAPYPAGFQVDVGGVPGPHGDNEVRVNRGGGYESSPSETLPGLRGWKAPGDGFEEQGFRVVLPALSSSSP